ncbi:hypothetical protein D9619_009011 [Psilocybe cf. subviscida]|uniref:Cytochrome P450 n=1 Tax=Psilocybe cf. subviscida TaxID=2480587 RepID=A0A8H5BUH0_9AGAR|nr:hypothetical protein D9619_009011 [Psilocybe cf. subviscida]
MGDVVHIDVFGQSMIILNSLKAARDLLEKRSSIYSDRPRFVLLSELPGLAISRLQARHTHTLSGPRFRKHRRFINQVFNHRAIAAFRPLQEKEILTLLEGMLDNPDAFVDHFRRYAAATILKITYGHDIVSVDDLFVQLAERAGTLTVETGTPAANMVDFFPVIRHIPTWAPFSTFKIKALETRKAVKAMMEIPFEQVKADMRSGTAVPSYTSTLLDSHRDSSGSITPEDEEDIRGSAGTLFAAAEDTTISSIHTFILSMVLHPEEFNKAQEEMDAVIGRHRLPSIDDRPSLPYLECILKEVLRLNPMVPLGMPHRLMEDDFYRFFYIPQGTTVLANIYAILRECDDSDVFRPQRYLDDDGLPDPLGVIFGFGRRHLAEASYWTIAASMVSAFDITKAFDEHGNDINKDYGFTHGFVRPERSSLCTHKVIHSSLRDIITKILIMDNNSEIKSQGAPLALPAPDAAATSDPQSSTRTLDVSAPGGIAQRITLDELGPMVVNSDGTLSRIANWAQMTEAERQRTLRVLSARNKLRLANEAKKLRDGEDGAGTRSPPSEAPDGEALFILNDASEGVQTASGQTPRPTAY